MKNAFLIFELGSLQVYTLRESSITGLDVVWTPDMPTDNYYWRDAASPQGYGPFNHISAAIEHYKWVIITCKGTQPTPIAPPIAEVIRFDFRSKKRVISDV